MSMHVNKNGIIGGVILESLGTSLISPAISYQYTPGTGVNSCLAGQQITGFEANKKYYAELLLTWGGGFEKTNSSGTFRSLIQGAQYDGSSWGWNYGNPLTNALNVAASSNGITSVLLSATSGSKKLSVTFTNTITACSGYELSVRCDYANGKGWIRLSNIKIIPYDQYIAVGESACRITSDKIIVSEIIEI